MIPIIKKMTNFRLGRISFHIFHQCFSHTARYHPVENGEVALLLIPKKCSFTEIQCIPNSKFYDMRFIFNTGLNIRKITP